MRSACLPVSAEGVASMAGIILALALGGCGGGGGGGGHSPGSGDVRNGVASDVTQTDLGGGRIEVRFTLTSPTSKKLGVEIKYSQDRGLTFSTATIEAESTSASPASLPSSPGGVRHAAVWLIASDIGQSTQHDLCIQVSPYDASTQARGISARSEVFGFGSNGLPVVSGLSTPSGTRGGWISFNYTVADPDDDFVGLEGQFSLDGGSSWSEAALGQGDGAGSVSAPSGGAAHTISWNSQADVPGLAQSGVMFRLRAADIDPGAFSSSGSFTIDTRSPSVDLLTLNQITREMNGSLAFTNTGGNPEQFTLLAPESGFEISVLFSSGGADVDPSGVRVSADGPLGGGASAGGADADQDFGASFTVDVSSGLARLLVPEELRFPAGPHTITARVFDLLGNPSDPVSYTFDTKAATPAHLPFDPADRWYLSFTRDNYDISATTGGTGTVTITSTAGSNGVADFVEDLRILGLQSASPPPAAQSAGLNALVLESIEEAVMGRLNEMYGRNFDGSSAADGSAIQFSLTAPAAPYSKIAIGGKDPIPGFTIGRAEFDYRNSASNDDTDSDLGVFTTNLIDFYINSSFTFRSRFNPLIPGRGTALGFDPLDVTVLGPSFDRSDPGNSSAENTRYDQIDQAIDAIARATATILAHEIGHSVGLVANSAPPAGLFGGEFMASFAGPYTNTYHLDTGDNEIMAAALSFSDSILPAPDGPRFNKLAMAYLLERIILE
jgi:hypothetical protein